MFIMYFMNIFAIFFTPERIIMDGPCENDAIFQKEIFFISLNRQLTKNLLHGIRKL
jgi:hypothetical protein